MKAKEEILEIIKGQVREVRETGKRDANINE